MTKPLAAKVTTPPKENVQIGQLAVLFPGVMWFVRVTMSQLRKGSRCVKFCAIALILTLTVTLATGSSKWQKTFLYKNMATGSKNIGNIITRTRFQSNQAFTR